MDELKAGPERMMVLAEKLPKSADESPVDIYNELFGSAEAKELVRLAMIAQEFERQSPEYYRYVEGVVNEAR